MDSFAEANQGFGYRTKFQKANSLKPQSSCCGAKSCARAGSAGNSLQYLGSIFRDSPFSSNEVVIQASSSE
jgi:hypothetical protein